VKLFPFEDYLGPLPEPPIRITASKLNLWIEAFIGREWVTVARRARRRPPKIEGIVFWISLCENLGLVEPRKGRLDFLKLEKYED
jgi:hypothetical protein